MNPFRRYLKNKKGINTILASLLMVVIVVVASVMVYAWSTGLLGTLLVQPNVGKEALTMDTFAFPNNNNVTLTLRNAGTVAVTFSSYYVKMLQVPRTPSQDGPGAQRSNLILQDSPTLGSPRGVEDAVHFRPVHSHS